MAEAMEYRAINQLNLPFRPLEGRGKIHSPQIDAAYMLTPYEEWGLLGLVAPASDVRSASGKAVMVDRRAPDGRAEQLGEMAHEKELCKPWVFSLEDQTPEVRRRVSNLFWRARAVQDMLWWLEALERLSVGQVALLDRERLAGLRWGDLRPIPWEALASLPFDRRRVIDALLDFGYPSRTIIKAITALDSLRKLNMLLHLATELPVRLRLFPTPLFLPARKWAISDETMGFLLPPQEARLPKWLRGWGRGPAYADADGHYWPGPPSWRDCQRAHRLLAGDGEAG